MNKEIKKENRVSINTLDLPTAEMAVLEIKKALGLDLERDKKFKSVKRQKY